MTHPYIRRMLSSTNVRLVSVGAPVGKTTLTETRRPSLDISVPGRGLKLIIQTSTDAPWLRPLVAEFADILSLPANWNSYGACEVDPNNVVFALEDLLPMTMHANTPMPRVVPTAKGGVLLEWHERGIDLEVEVIAPGRVYVYYEDDRTGNSWEGELRSDLAPLAEPFLELSTRQ
jgi:hypothetical protein